ncbi:MAG TPA: hypothetical protein VLK84_01695 [Longimicrobium sp.]|nr:hypothetical protein [Longimicrobium sp.]
MPAETRAGPGFLLPRLDRLHARVRGSGLLYRFTLATRILLAVGFIPTGMVKLLGRRFTTMDPASDIGAFFEVMYQSGEYWRFIGAAQILAGILMLIPRTATLGAVLFMPVITSIFVITLSYDFRGTPLVTGMMLLATVYLLCWDWHRVRPLLSEAPREPLPLPVHRLTAAERGIYTVGVASAFVAFFAMRSLLPPALMGGGLLVAALAAVTAAGAWALHVLPSRRTAAG